MNNDDNAWNGPTPPPELQDAYTPPPECNPCAFEAYGTFNVGEALKVPVDPVQVVSTDFKANALAVLQAQAAATQAGMHGQCIPLETTEFGTTGTFVPFPDQSRHIWEEQNHPGVPVRENDYQYVGPILSAEALAALEYYADPANYVDGEYGHQLIAPIELDKGEKARKVLAQYASRT